MIPTGTVTFLFTDLQGSTRALEDHPEAMRQSVARHDELLRAAILRGQLDHALELTRSADYFEHGLHEPAFLLIILGQYEEAARSLASAAGDSSVKSFGGGYREPLVRAMADAARGHADVATEHLAVAMRMIDRRPLSLLDRDILIGAAVLAYHRGDIERAAVLLAVERQHLTGVRSPGSWALYLHYRDLVRAALDRPSIDAAKVIADRYTITTAIAEELAR